MIFISDIGKMSSAHLQLAKQIATLFAALPQVEAVALGGSRGSGAGSTDSASDIDLYVYTHGAIPLAERRAIVERSGGASQASLDLTFWGPGDEWINAPTGIEVDMVYFEADWMEEQIRRVVEKHLASLGYSTCFWYTVRNSIIYADPRGWFAALQQRCQIEYPEALRQNIVALNYPVLRSIIPAYGHQIEKAAKRSDLVSINHRTAALLASYFDILFAANRQLHPGEKRLVEGARARCAVLPANMKADLAAILLLTAADIGDLPARLAKLLDHLDQMLEQEGFDLKLLA
jgi:hypothetical protein